MPTSNRNRLTAVLTLGDPAGIGPEVILKAVHSSRIRALGRFVIVGTEAVFERTERLTRLRWPKDIRLVALENLKQFRYGEISPRYGRAAFLYLREAVRLLKDGAGDFLVTAPIQKESMEKAGFHWPGHTELLKDLTKSKKVNMMFSGKKFCVSLVTWHIALRKVPGEVTKEKVLDAVFFLDQALRRYFSKKYPKLALCGLNPHAGEGGRFGDEEKRVLVPALAAARKKGIRIEGPIPADALFYKAYQGGYDGVVAMYHDQALAPFKAVERDYGVNVTLGLPFIRTSPDHGTAFDIAGKNKADPRSMMRAIHLAFDMKRSERRYSRR